MIFRQLMSVTLPSGNGPGTVQGPSDGESVGTAQGILSSSGGTPIALVENDCCTVWCQRQDPTVESKRSLALLL